MFIQWNTQNYRSFSTVFLKVEWWKFSECGRSISSSSLFDDQYLSLILHSVTAMECTSKCSTRCRFCEVPALIRSSRFVIIFRCCSRTGISLGLLSLWLGVFWTFADGLWHVYSSPNLLLNCCSTASCILAKSPSAYGTWNQNVKF